jgi:hypothetical protein
LSPLFSAGKELRTHAIRKLGAAALLLLKLLIDHLGVVDKRSLIFRILSEVGVFLHVNPADGPVPSRRSGRENEPE